MSGHLSSIALMQHAFGKRYELPVPLWLFLLGGALVVVLSFIVVLPREVAGGEFGGMAVAERLAPRTTVAPGAVGGLVLAALTLCGLFGSQEVAENILPVTFWLVFWIAVPLSCAVVGDWTGPVNPFAAIARAADRPELRRWALGDERPQSWSPRVGWWPATLLYFAAVCGELIFNLTATVPHVLATGLLVYAGACAVGGFLFGTSWVTYGEMFGVLYATWGRLGYRRFGAAGRDGFAGGLDIPFEPVSSRIAFVLLLLVSVNFDGLLATPSWANFEANLPGGIAVGPEKLQLFRMATLAVLAVAVAVGFGSFAVWSGRVGGGAGGYRRRFAALLPSLLPIAFGYLLAHNIEYLVVNLQLLFPLLGNPAGLANWPSFPYPFNDSYDVRTHLLPSGAYWYFSIAVIVAVHVVAVILAHRHLDRAGTDKRRARASELPWLVAMVGYTVLSLWLVAQPLTR